MTADRNGPYESIWADLQGVPFEQGYADAGGIATRYLRAGGADKPGLVFLHGTGGHAEAYVRNLAAHAPHFDTYAIDMLGHGYTGKPDYDYEIPRYIDHLAGFLDAVGIERVSLSGESLGGWVAGAFAVAHPDRVDRLVLNTAGADMVNPEALAALRASTAAAVEDPSWERVRTRLEWLMRTESDVHDDLVASRQAIYSRPEMKERRQPHPLPPYSRRRGAASPSSPRNGHGSRRPPWCSGPATTRPRPSTWARRWPG